VMRRLFWLLMAVLLAHGGPLTAAESTSSPSSTNIVNQPLTELPLGQKGSYLVITASVNGSRPIRFALGNRYRNTVMGRSQATEAKLGNDLRKIKGVSFALGGYKYSPRKISTNIMPETDPPIDGFFGVELFERFVVELDFANKKFRL